MNKPVMLGHKIAVYVPSTVGVDKRLDAETVGGYVNDIASTMAHCFGGATIIDGIGAWISEEKKGLVEEKVKIVYSFCNDEAFDKYRNYIEGICREIAYDMEQEAVSMEIDGSLYLITQD